SPVFHVESRFYVVLLHFLQTCLPQDKLFLSILFSKLHLADQIGNRPGAAWLPKIRKETTILPVAAAYCLLHAGASQA
ncbi:MAG: hypothetical protein RL120_16505, partial [Gammaproteobacteria bacterium]